MKPGLEAFPLKKIRTSKNRTNYNKTKQKMPKGKSIIKFSQKVLVPLLKDIVNDTMYLLN
jgi:hypothetical protein